MSLMAFRAFGEQNDYPMASTIAVMMGIVELVVIAVALLVIVVAVLIGVLAASILVLVRTVGMFELTFLVSGPQSDTLVVAMYRAMTAAGGGTERPPISSMAVVYTVTMMVSLIIALRFVRPTQLVARVKDSRED